MLIDELVNCCEKLRSWGRFPPFQKIDELLNGLLLLGSQSADKIGKVLGGHSCVPLAVYPSDTWVALAIGITQEQ